MFLFRGSRWLLRLILWFQGTRIPGLLLGARLRTFRNQLSRLSKNLDRKTNCCDARLKKPKRHKHSWKKSNRKMVSRKQHNSQHPPRETST